MTPKVRQQVLRNKSSRGWHKGWCGAVFRRGARARQRRRRRRERARDGAHESVAAESGFEKEKLLDRGGGRSGCAAAGRHRQAISNVAKAEAAAREIDKEFERVRAARLAQSFVGKSNAWKVLGIASNVRRGGEKGASAQAVGETRHGG